MVSVLFPVHLSIILLRSGLITVTLLKISTVPNKKIPSEKSQIKNPMSFLNTNYFFSLLEKTAPLLSIFPSATLQFPLALGGFFLIYIAPGNSRVHWWMCCWSGKQSLENRKKDWVLVLAIIHISNINSMSYITLLALHFLICKMGLIITIVHISISKSDKNMSEKVVWK